MRPPDGLQRPAHEIEVGQHFGGVGVGVPRGRIEARPHVPQLPPVGLVGVARADLLARDGHGGGVGGNRRVELLGDGHHAPRDAQRAGQLSHALAQQAQRHLALEGQGLVQDVGRDVGVSILVAAHPGAETEECRRGAQAGVVALEEPVHLLVHLHGRVHQNGSK